VLAIETPNSTASHVRVERRNAKVLEPIRDDTEFEIASRERWKACISRRLVRTALQAR